MEAALPAAWHLSWKKVRMRVDVVWMANRYCIHQPTHQQSQSNSLQDRVRFSLQEGRRSSVPSEH